MANNTSEGNWCLIESDPGVFTEIIKGFGVKGIECEEIIDIDYISNLVEPFGLIFLYKWANDSKSDSRVVKDSEALKNIFFAKQVITNACATQAILNILFNLKGNVELGETLSGLKEFCASFDSHMKGLTISNSNEIRKVHNSFSSSNLYEIDDKKVHSSEETYHFVGYMPIDGRLYELDGLQEGPIDLGPIDKSWIEAVTPVMVSRMQQCSNTYFNIMALVPDKLEMLENQLKILQESGDPEEQIPQILSGIQDEKNKHEKYRIENIRRRHNYMPFIIELMKILAEEGQLTTLVERAEELANTRHVKSLAGNSAKVNVTE